MVDTPELATASTSAFIVHAGTFFCFIFCSLAMSMVSFPFPNPAFRFFALRKLSCPMLGVRPTRSASSICAGLDSVCSTYWWKIDS